MVALLGARLGSNMPEPMPAMSFDDQLMSVVVNVDIVTKHHDFICVSKDGCNLLEGDALGLGEDEEHPQCTEAGDDDEDL